MATQTEEVKVSISAQVSELLDGLKTASSAVKTSTEEMKTQFGSLGSVIDAVKAPLLGLTAVLGGGSIFKSAIDATVSWNSEVIKMSKSLGMSAQDASVLAVALNGLGLTTDQYMRAANVLARQVSSNSEAFNRLGIETTDSSGKLRSSVDLTNDAIKTIASYKEGIDRNAAGVSLFGRQWVEVAPLLKLGSVSMEEARDRAEKLGLMMGPGSEAQTKAYKLAMIGVEESMKGIQVQVGTALMPTLTTLARWFGEQGTNAAASFRDVINGVVLALMGVKAVIDTVLVALTAFVQNALAGFGAIGEVVQRIINRDFSGAAMVFKNAQADMVQTTKDAAGYIAQVWTDLAKKRDELFAAKMPPVLDQASGGGGRSFTPGKAEDQTANNDKAVAQYKIYLENMYGQDLAYAEKMQKLKDAKEKEDRKRAEEAAKAQAEMMTSMADRMGSMVGASFEGMIRGTMSFSKAVADMAKEVVKLIRDMVIKIIMARAAEAAAGAAASQSGIPIIGPVLAIGAIAAMSAAVMALLGSVPSASGGFDIPSGVNPLTQLHGGEMVLPASIADPLRGALASGGVGGGDSFRISITAIDAKGVRDLVMGDDFVRALREAVRRGRL